MKTTTKILLVISLIIFAQAFIFAGKDTKIQVAPKYKEWLDLVTYIITQQEKDIFFILKDDHSRDLFIESFWRHRDPTPGTPQNEFKDEIIRRFDWANKYLRGEGKPGWMTDRGRLYMVLGEPISKTRVNTSDVYPAEVWYYYGEPGSGLPSHFGLIFYQKAGAGDYRLYNPVVDGPDSLMLQHKEYDPFDYETVYEKLKAISPDLADVALSVVPGDMPYGYQPSPENATTISNILNYQKKKANTEYARNFQKYQGLVDVEYSVNYIPHKSIMAVSYDPLLNTYAFHYAIKLYTVSVDTYNEKIYTNFELNGTIKDQKDAILFQYKKNFSMYYDETQLAQLKKNGLVFEDMIPVVPGASKIQLLLKNTLSKEFTYSEYTLSFSENAPAINDIFIAYASDKDISDIMKPFKFSETEFKIDPDVTFVSSDSVYLYYSINNLVPPHSYALNIAISLDEKIIKTIPHTISPDKKYYEASEPIPIGDFIPGTYEVTLTLSDSQNNKLALKKTLFHVSAVEKIARPNIASKSLSSANTFLMNQILGDQYFAMHNYAEALNRYQHAYDAKKDFLPIIKGMIESMLMLKKENDALNLIEHTPVQNADADYYFLCGRTYELNKNNEKSEYYYLESLKISKNIKTLNALGVLYLKMNKIKEAKAVLTESLSIKQDQTEVKELMGN